MTLEAALGAGRWHAAQVGLGRWNDTAEGYLAAERAAREASESALAARAELLGRLSARRAQIQSLMMKGMPVAPELDLRAREIEAVLRIQPVSIDAANKQIEDFEARLSASLGRRH